MSNDNFLKLAKDLEHFPTSLADIHRALTKAEEYKVGLFERAPAQKGDRIVLCDTPVINEKEAYGWLHAKHFLIKGAKATVHEVEFYNNKFMFALKFDDDSYIDIDGVKTMTKDKGLYYFPERYIIKI